MSAKFRIDPDGFYTEVDLVVLLEIGRAVLDRARRRGELKCAQKGRYRYFKGEWVLRWLESDASPQEVSRAN
jgi:hypothetical protein